MKKIKNSKKDKFLKSIPTTSLDDDNDDFTARCKFNFSYMDFSQVPPGQKFEEWTEKQLSELLNKLKDYNRESLKYWENKRVGKHNHVLEVYGQFPLKSDFKHPSHVPHQAKWARFRLESRMRLIGFVLPQDYSDKQHCKTKAYYDCNTFYVVFLDRDHRFYKTKKR